MTKAYSSVVETAREYYNSGDADSFYAVIWGGEDIHIGLYEGPEDNEIRQASHRSVRKLAEQVALTPQQKVLDIGSGYAGTARYFAKTFGCHVDALNLSEVQNQRARKLNEEQGLDHLITVIDGSFEDIPGEDGANDVVISQDAILHSGNKKKVFQEVFRVLKSGGQFVFTDPMQADDVPEGVLQPVLDRIHLDAMGSFALYRQLAKEVGLEEVNALPMTDQLVNHYSAVLRVTEAKAEEIKDQIGGDYIHRMKTGLNHWITAGKNGHLAWGILHFRKP